MHREHTVKHSSEKPPVPSDIPLLNDPPVLAFGVLGLETDPLRAQRLHCSGPVLVRNPLSGSFQPRARHDEEPVIRSRVSHGGIFTGIY